MKIKRPPILCGTFAMIPLTRGKHAVIDIEDLPLVEGRSWCASPRHSGMLWYAMSRYGAQPQYLHRVIIQPPPGMDVDHVNRNGLDNRRRNLRVCSRAQNLANGRYGKTGTSAFRGVCMDCSRGKWKASIGRGNNRYNLGRYANEVEAAIAYDEAAIAQWGEFATLNFPDRTADSVIPSPRTNLTDNGGTPVGGTTTQTG